MSSDTKPGDDVERLRGSLEFIRDRARNQIRICEGKGNYVAHAIVKECDAALAATPSRCEVETLLAEISEAKGWLHDGMEKCNLGFFKDSYNAQSGVMGKLQKIEVAIQSMQRRPVNAWLPSDEWREDMGNVLWTRLPVEEPPYCGTPLDSGFPPNYYTHFTTLILPPSSTDGGAA